MRTVLLAGAVSTGVGPGYATAQIGPISANQTYQATVVGTGSVTATVNIEVSDDNVGWLVLSTLALSGTTSASDGFTSIAPWQFARANVTAISGTGAAVTVTMGE